MKIRFIWRAEPNQIMNIVSMTGVMEEPEKVLSSSFLLLQNALEMIQVAEHFGGRVIPSKPPQKDGEFVYFQVMFRNHTDCTHFLKTITKESS